ncbi:MotA/TolQ/ExbB proton channel family protein [Burkholderiaceae bacterium DAT-1]|nr:MotA/TolQ/ExbB proton channel family protein [Burkholderiaceae bacterium DAT-1]
MNVQLLHDLSFYAMYVCALIGVMVIVERLIFFFVTMKHAKELEAVMHHDVHSLADLPQELVNRDSVPVEVLREMLEVKAKLSRRSDLEDMSDAIYIAMKAKLHSRLWILDTIVTAAPLLGLLGTILGIIDTFKVLAANGVSDTAGVSQGIGTALFATALGIAIALFGLVFFNHFQERIDRINDHIKILLLRAGIGTEFK